MGTMYQPDEIDFVNPYLSPRRQWVCTQLAILLPNNVVTVASNDKKTRIFFEEWTGQSQTNLETTWEKKENFRRAVTDDEKKRGVWIRDGGGPVTTSCEGLIGRVVGKLTAAGFGKPNRGKMTSFNLAGCGANGREPATTVGWHWYRDRTESLHPQPGDLFQIGKPANTGQWSFAHVGVITGWIDGANPIWTTVEAGQGGPSRAFDFIKRKGPRPVNPVDPKSPKKELMGWLDIDEFFGG